MFIFRFWSDECIDATIRYLGVFFVFVVCVHAITCRNNALIYNFRVGFWWQIVYSWYNIQVKVPAVFKSVEKKHKKMTEKREFFRKTSFWENRLILYYCNSKTNHSKYLKFPQNVYNNVIYTRLNFQNTLDIFELFIDNYKFQFIKFFFFEMSIKYVGCTK